MEVRNIKKNTEYGKLMPNTSQHQEKKVGSSFSRPIAENCLNHMDEFVVGMEDDIIQLVEFLTNPDYDFTVIGIVGCAGAGKRTLATQLYRHNVVQSWFSHKAYVCVSQRWTRIDIICRMYNQFKGNKGDIRSCNVEELVGEVRDFIKDKKCLVVFEDVWDTDFCDDKFHIFPPTSDFKVILTCRHGDIIWHADKECIIYQRNLLSDVQKRELFRKGAMEGRQGIENNVEFEKANKLVTLAGILRTKQQLREWEGVNKAFGDYILKERTCSHDQQMGSESLEDAAMRQLDELAQRYILRVIKRNVEGEIEIFCLHELMRDFCIKKATEYHFLQTVTSTSTVGEQWRPRQISIFSRRDETNENPVCFGGGNTTTRKGAMIPKFPKDMGNLIHLTYLSVVDTEIRELPASIRNLRNLMYLQYHADEGKIVAIPNDLVRNMKNLRLLELPIKLERGICRRKSRLGLGRERHKNLHTSRCGAGTWMTKDLPTLSSTLLSLEIYDITEIEEMEALYHCLCFLKGSVHKLTIRLNRDWLMAHKSDVLEKLIDFQSLWSLDLQARLTTNCIIQFPPNLEQGRNSAEHLQEQRRKRCRASPGTKEGMVHNRAQNLQHLQYSRAYMGTRLSCAGTGQLEYNRMEFGRMCYESSRKDRDNQLSGLEETSRRSINTLEELTVKKMPEEFYRRLGHHDLENGGSNSEQGEDFFIIQHIPSVQFYMRGL
ncbi:LOW QUALITY PROTEIN: hypothetical protein V2J09_013624 [Rumex salicifolius]